MRIPTMTTDTVVYATSENGGDARYRAVVLDTERWQAVRHRHQIVGYELAPRKGGRGDTYTNVTGILAVRSGGRGFHLQGEEVSDAELIDWAARVAVAVKEGGAAFTELAASLPADVNVALLRPRDVETTWSEYAAGQRRAQRQAEREQARRAEAARVESAARERLVIALGDACPPFAPVGIGGWVGLERLCQRYAEAVGSLAEQTAAEKLSAGTGHG